jgi:hypothetical protein
MPTLFSDVVLSRTDFAYDLARSLLRGFSYLFGIMLLLSFSFGSFRSSFVAFELVNALSPAGFSGLLVELTVVLGPLFEFVIFPAPDAFKLLPLTELSISFLDFLGWSLGRSAGSFSRGEEETGRTGDCPELDAPQPMLILFIKQDWAMVIMAEPT